MNEEQLQQKTTGLLEKAVGSEKISIAFSESLAALRLQEPFVLLNFLSIKVSESVVYSGKSERKIFEITETTVSVRIVSPDAMDRAATITTGLDRMYLAPAGMTYRLISAPVNQTHLEPASPGISRYSFDFGLTISEEITRPRNLIDKVIHRGELHGCQH